MIKESAIKTFQENNKESDIMGVVRTLHPDIRVKVSKKTKKKS